MKPRALPLAPEHVKGEIRCADTALFGHCRSLSLSDQTSAQYTVLVNLAQVRLLREFALKGGGVAKRAQVSS